MSDTDEFQRRVEEIKHSFRAMAVAVIPPLRAFGEQLAVLGQAVENMTERAYEDAGKPYGDSYEGKWRWLRELAEAERLRAKADEIESWHRALAIIREARDASEAEENSL